MRLQNCSKFPLIHGSIFTLLTQAFCNCNNNPSTAISCISSARHFNQLHFMTISRNLWPQIVVVVVDVVAVVLLITMQHQVNRKGKTPTPKREPLIFPLSSPEVVLNSFSISVAVGSCVTIIGIKAR